METDLTSIIIVIIASACFFVPIIYFEYFKKRAARRFTAYFRKISKNNNLTLSQYDVWDDQYGIGIDEVAKKMIYLNKFNGHDVTVLQDLTELNKCRTVKKNNVIKMPDGDRNIPTRIDLQLGFLNPDKKDVTIGFYDGEIGESVRDEVILAEKWSRIINSKVKNR
jgi:hypothetical protein